MANKTIAYGSEYPFNEDTSIFVSVAVLDSTHFVVVYQDVNNSKYGTAVVGTISGSTINYGLEYVFNTAESIYTSVAVLDSTHFVVAYRDVGNSNHGTAIVGTISSVDEINYGLEYVFNTAETNYISVASLDSTHFVVGYRDDGNSRYGTAIVGTVSSVDEINYGLEYPFNEAETREISVASLDSVHFVVGYRDDGGDDYGCAVVGTISSVDEIDYGLEYPFNESGTYSVSVASLDSTHFVAGYRDDGNSKYGTAIVGTVSSVDEIDYGLEYVFSEVSNGLGFISIAVLDSTSFVIVYRDYTNWANHGASIVGTVSSVDEINYSSMYEFNPANTNYTSVAVLDLTHFVVGYQDSGNSGYGTAIVGTIVIPPQTVTHTIQAKAAIKRELIQTVTSRATIRKSFTQTLTAKGRIGISSIQTITAKGRITISTIQTIESKANIREVITQTIDSKGNIKKSLTQTIESKGSIKKLFTKTITAKARTGIIGIQTVIAKANIQNTIAQTITTKTRIEKEFTQTVQAKARIQKSFAQTITAKAIIKISQTQTVATKGRISITTTRNIDAKADIKAIQIQIITSKAIIKREFTQTIEAKGRVTIASTQIVAVKGRIGIASSQAIQAKGRIGIAEQQTITAKAEIICLSKPILVTPTHLSVQTSPVYLVWEISSCCKNRNIHTHIEIDKTDNTFNDLEKDLYSFRDPDFEYWDGSNWQTYPTSGISSVYYGNQARVLVTLTTGNKWWSANGGVK